MKSYPATYLLYIFVLMTLPLHASADRAETDSIAELSKINGADIALYQIYDENKDKDRDKAADYARLFLSRIDPDTANIYIAHVCDWLGNYYEMDRFLFSKAIEWRENALKQYEDIGDIYAKAKTEYHLSILYYKKSQYHKVLKYADDAIRVFKQLGCDDDAMECYKILGVAYKTCGDMDKSDEYFQEYARLAKILDDSIKIAKSMNNLAAFASSINDTAKAIRFSLEAIEYAKGLTDDEEMCKFYLNTAAVFTEAGQYGKAREYLSQAAPKLANIDLEGHYHTINGLIYHLNGEDRKSIDSFKAAIDAYEKGEFEQQLAGIYGLMNSIYRHLGDTAEAYRYLQKMYEYEETVNHDEIMIELFKVQSRLETAQLDKIIEDGRNRQKTTGIISMAGIIILILGAFTIIKRKSYKMKEKEIEMESQRKLAEERRIYYLRIESISDKAVGDLTRIARNVKDLQTKRDIAAVCAELSDTKNDEMLEEMKNYVPDFNTELYKNLSKEFPNLTVNESRICVLLSRNLSTKQISEITRQSPESINLARTRLRKKLGITGVDISIQEFLRKYDS